MHSDSSRTWLGASAAADVAPVVSSPAAIRSVLVPLDGTQHAEHAIPHALALVRRTGGVVRIAQVYSYQEEIQARDSSWWDDDPARAIREPRERYLQRIVRRISRRCDVPVVATLQESDQPQALLRSLQGEVDLTVMTSRRRSWFSRFCRESMADSLLAGADRPVLLVRGHDGPVDLTGDPVCRRVLIPAGGPDDLTSILGAGGLAERCPMAMAVTVIPLGDWSLPAASAWIDRYRGERPACDLRLETRPVRTAQGVLEYADSEDVDWIAVTLDRSFGSLPRIGAGAEQSIVARSSIPVLIRMRPVPGEIVPVRAAVIASSPS